MKEKKSDLEAAFEKLNEERIRELQQLKATHDKMKQEHERLYYIQFDEYKLNSQKFGEKKAAIQPPRYNALLDKEFAEKTQALLAEQSKEDKEREQFKQVHFDFRQGMDDIKKPANENTPQQQPEAKPKSEEKTEDIDPRRLAFRKEMEEIRQQQDKDKDKDKDLDKEV